MPKIEERRFVAFDVAAIEVDLIVAVVGAVKKIGGVEEEVVIIILETGANITLYGRSKDEFLFWWVENMKEKGHTEKVEMPEVLATLVAEAPPVATASPPPTPTPTVLTEAPITPESIVSDIATQVAPEPPPVVPPVQPPSLSDIGKA